MPSIRLTQLAVEKLAAPQSGRRFFGTATLPGFGLRMTAKGAKSWVAMYRVDGKPVMETLGADRSGVKDRRSPQPGAGEHGEGSSRREPGCQARASRGPSSRNTSGQSLDILRT